jgi:hypothetical protein
VKKRPLSGEINEDASKFSAIAKCAKNLKKIKR